MQKLPGSLAALAENFRKLAEFVNLSKGVKYIKMMGSKSSFKKI
jgi:hypothetical protein